MVPTVLTTPPPHTHTMGRSSSHSHHWKPSTIHLSNHSHPPSSETEVLVYYIGLFSYCICVLKVHACYSMFVWRSKDSLHKVVLSFTIEVQGLSGLMARGVHVHCPPPLHGTDHRPSCGFSNTPMVIDTVHPQVQ